MLQSKGIDPSTLINRVVTLFLDLPEDPAEKLVRIQSEEIMIRLRIQYEQEIRDRIRESATQQQVQDLERARAEQRIEQLLKFGELLQQNQRRDRVMQALRGQDYEAPVWDNVLEEINRVNGGKWTLETLQSTAIDWWKRYGQATHA